MRIYNRPSSARRSSLEKCLDIQTRPSLRHLMSGSVQPAPSPSQSKKRVYVHVPSVTAYRRILPNVTIPAQLPTPASEEQKSIFGGNSSMSGSAELRPASSCDGARPFTIPALAGYTSASMPPAVPGSTLEPEKCRFCLRKLARARDVPRHEAVCKSAPARPSKRVNAESCPLVSPPAKKRRTAIDDSARPSISQPDPDMGGNFEELKSAFSRKIKTYVLENQSGTGKDICTFLKHAQPKIIEKLQEEVGRSGPLKFNLFLESKYMKPEVENKKEEESVHSFKTKSIVIYNVHDIPKAVTEGIGKICREETEFMGKGSGWSLAMVKRLQLRVSALDPLRASSYIALPAAIKSKHAIINPQNQDHKCFKYAVLARFIEGAHPERIDVRYTYVEPTFDFSGLTFPTPINEINKFEKKNPDVSVNIYRLSEEHRVIPTRISDKEKPRHFDLLLIGDGKDNMHYCYIKDFSRLVRSQITAHKEKIYICKRCFTYYDDQARKTGLSGQQRLTEHTKYCKVYGATRIQMPLPVDGRPPVLQFNNFHHADKMPIVAYCDFEAMLKPVASCSPDPNQSYTEIYQRHEAYSFGIYLKIDNSVIPGHLTSHLPQQLIIYRGVNAAEKFMETIVDIGRKVQDIYNTTEKMLSLSPEQQQDFTCAMECCYCHETFTEKNCKVKDHDHFTGYYRGASCNNCNLKRCRPKKMPVFFHNLNYDESFIIPYLGYDDKEITIIPHSQEKFITFSKKLGGKFSIQFVDTFRFMSRSLASLAEYLPKQKFHNTSKFNTPEQLPLVIRKGVFPYDYVTDVGKLDDTCLPPPSAFHNRLTDSNITEPEYMHAQAVWNMFSCRTLGDYSDLYLRTDVLLLADVFENFRDLCLDTYGLDCAHYISAPSFTFDAMLKTTGVKLELLTDYDQHLFIEAGIRGGVAQCIKRHCVANNKYMGDVYDPDVPSTFIQYLDANNLYGWAMSLPLPYANFHWTDTDIDVTDVPDDGPIGYILEVDITYPEELHEDHRDFPFLAVNQCPPNSKFSKLMTTLQDKQNYIVHYRNLKQAIEHGLKVTKIHRVLQFSQAPWLKSYIELNTSKRQMAENQFQKEFFKLANNATFGKLMENKRNRQKMELVCNEKRLRKLVAKPAFIDCTIYNENLCLVNLATEVILFDKPVYAGLAVLDLSKTLMYTFHYEKMKPRYGDAIELAYMDTDSFIYHIETEDFYRDMTETSHLFKEFDTSNYPTSHPCHSMSNKAVLGKFKDETNGRVRTSAVLDAEARSHYWLTIEAQDHAVVALTSRLEVLVEVCDENDNSPLTERPVYRASVPENSPAGKLVVRLRAEDADHGGRQNFTFRIAAGNSAGFFHIDPGTGEILTTDRQLDREQQDEHVLEVVVTDDSSPRLQSSTRVVVAVEDENDHPPKFQQSFHKVRVPGAPSRSTPSTEESRLNATDEADASADSFIENMPWETFDAHALLGRPILRVLAHDPDAGDNGLVQYSIRSGRGGVHFQMHPETGEVHAGKTLLAGQEFQIRVRAEDRGSPKLWSESRVTLQVVGIPGSSAHPPIVAVPSQRVQVMEADAAGFLVALVQATDEDGDALWYDIIGGDERKEFFIGCDKGNILLAKQLDHETKSEYRLNISVTDGVHISHAEVIVSVLDNNDHHPSFTEPQYAVDISENVETGTKILQLRATDEDRDQKLSYSIHAAQDLASADMFKVDSVSGAVYLNKSLDREVAEKHILVVTVRDEGAPSKRDYARLIITVHDHNDHPPEFAEHLVEGRVHDTVAVGSVVARLRAIDWDRGENARITYSISSGNVGNAFTIDPLLGDVRVAKSLDKSVMSEYMIIVKATDAGSPILSSTIHLHIAVTMADNAPPRFVQKEYSAEIYENELIGKYVKHLDVRSMSSLFFEIVGGNGDDTFSINPSTGVIVTKKILDYEKQRFYNLTVEVTNMAGAGRRCAVAVHVLDRNDNAPRFPNTSYHAEVSESLAPGSLVHVDGHQPLVVAAMDRDSGPNGLVVHSIVNSRAGMLFRIDPRTGAVRTAATLDHETTPLLVFHVHAEDQGHPRLSASPAAEVRVSLADANDSPPRFLQRRYQGVVALPANRGVMVLRVVAEDRDAGAALRYDVVDGNPVGAFAVDPAGGEVTVARPEVVQFHHTLHVRASDGKFSTITQVDVFGVHAENPDFRFQKGRYEAAVQENSTRVVTLAVLCVLGAALNEHISFSLLTPSDMFTVGGTSGALKTTGRPFDREATERHELVVQALSGEVAEEQKLRLAVTSITVTILDINDNCPMFVNLPYHCIVSTEARKWDVIIRVHAVDLDKGDNGEVRYELSKGHGELFKVDRKTGEIQLKQNLEGHVHSLNTPYELTIAAYDGGMVPCSTEVLVLVKVTDKSMPVFEHQEYQANIPENTEPGSPLPVTLRADSQPGHRLVYNIVSGDDEEQFILDFSTAPNNDNGPCVLYLADELDYERRSTYHLTIQAVDMVTGASAETKVHISVEDVNDCPPEFVSQTYAVSMLESAAPGTAVLAVFARDNDTGINQIVRYEMLKDADNNSDYFHVDPRNGTIYLKQSLDHERQTSHIFTVVALDSGRPSLSSSTHVHISVEDVNDNPPQFEREEYTCLMSGSAVRGHFVTKVAASDPDEDILRYAIVSGNDQQRFFIDPITGVVTLAKAHDPGGPMTTSLEVVASDGVHSSLTRVRVEPLAENLHSPQFQRSLLEVHVLENQPAGAFVARATAVDRDLGVYGRPVYSIPSDVAKEAFRIDKHTGVVTTRKPLDRELQVLHEIPVMATDIGGRSGHLLVRVKVADENDNHPRFLLHEYKVTIRSNATATLPILQVKAVDSDEGVSAEVEYSIFQNQLSGMKDSFGINRFTGEIVLLRSAVSLENQAFQFFVRAQDRGTPSLHEDVPVEVLVIGSDDYLPVFEKTDTKFFILENSPPGTVVTRLRLVGDPLQVRFRLVSGDVEGPSHFSVDSSGRLRVARPLDREVKDHHVVGVLAEVGSGISVAALAELTVRLLDEDDNPPVFHSRLYRALLAEDVVEGTSVLRVLATDADEGAGGEVRYSLSPDAGTQFVVNAHTGWLTTAALLDREERGEFLLQVVASGGMHVARTTVIVKLHDYNDNPPVFSRTHYVAAVNEGAPLGTVVLRLSTTDKDSGPAPPLQYLVTGGDPGLRFATQSGGEVVLARPLDREASSSHQLKVTVSDGKFSSHATVTVHILDDNDNPPVCPSDYYQEKVSEGVDPGTPVLTVLASDADEGHHSRIRFRLSGEGADDFALDKDTGELRTARLLDREVRPVYLLEARAQDEGRPSWGCSVQVRVQLADENDNPPRFTADRYSAALPEDTAVGALVARVRAIDPDAGRNRRVKYSLVSGDDGCFSITPSGGVVTLRQPLDRLSRALHNLTVRAEDGGSPPLGSTVPLIVVVLDAGDGPPEFAARTYRAALREDVAPGSEVARVAAASRDTAVRYAIVGGNEHGKFRVDAESGRVVTSGPLDYERAREYVLTVQAADRGLPPLASYASVHVAVLDANDNPPVFSQATYPAVVSEDAHPGHVLLQVVASDVDSDANGRISYAITKGDLMKHFAIDEKNGHISVAGKLDRETVSSYALEVRARDGGVPALSSIAVVNIEVLDANDNPPVFSQTNYTAIIQENKPAGSEVVKVQVSDADSAFNAEPFTFDMVSGNEQQVFSLGQDAVLRTAARLDHKTRDSYLLHIKVFDNGLPPLSSEAYVSVKVIEESQFPPVITPLQVFINSYLDEFSGGVIGRVHASDRDHYDTLLYSLSSELFTINVTDGTLTALPKLDIGEYRVNVSVTDGKFSSRTTLRVSVEMISDEMVQNAIILKFRGISPLDFVLNHKKGFQHAVRGSFNVRSKDIIIISIQPSTKEVRMSLKSSRRGQETSNNLNVLFAVRKHQESPDNLAFHPPDVVRAALTQHVEELELTTGLIVEEIVPNKCTANHCSHGECEDRVVLDTHTTVLVATERISFVFPHYQHQLICMCKEGYIGDRCDREVDECSRRPCGALRVCVPEPTARGYSCRCEDGSVGPTCDADSPECRSGACYAPRNPVFFSGKGYAQYSVDASAARSVLGDRLILSLRVRTVQLTGTIMYTAGQVDYNILEVVSGVIQYRFELGSGEGVVRVSGVYISDGSWHDVKVERELNDARVIIDRKHTARGSSPGPCRVLSTEPDRLYLGAEVRPHPTILGFEDVQRGFIGCVDEVLVSREAAPLRVGGGGGHVILRRFANAELGCAELEPLGACGPQPCLNGGTCISTGQNTFSCECHPRFAGPDCGLDTDPCASSPCLHGGHCKRAPSDDGYACECPSGLSGKRCHVGYYCNPNPCLNGGSCEEGDSSPVCTCQGFSGELCSMEVDECNSGLSSPCHNGATCVNEPGKFHCICPPNVTGPFCTEPLHSSRISSSAHIVTWEEAVGIFLGLVSILLAVAAFVMYRKFRLKRTHGSACHINNETNKDRVGANCTKLNENDFRRVSKLINLEVTQIPGPCQQHPVLYPNNEPGSCALNNLDSSSRSHGDDVPPDYLRNLDRSRQPSSCSVPTPDCDSKLAWAAHAESHGQATAHIGNKINNGCRWSSPGRTRMSDNPLPNIAEIPDREVIGSSRSQSDESNASTSSTPPFPVDDNGRTHDEPVYGTETEDCHRAISSSNHPAGCYCENEREIAVGPLGEQPDCKDECDQDEDDVVPYGFPSSRPGETGSVVTLLACTPGDGTESRCNDEGRDDAGCWLQVNVSRTSL